MTGKNLPILTETILSELYSDELIPVNKHKKYLIQCLHIEAEYNLQD